MGSVALGLPLYFTARPFAELAGFSGDDPFIYELGGAALLGYGVALTIGARRGEWDPMRFNVLATYVFSAMAFLAGFVALASSVLNGAVVLVMLWSVVVAYSTGRVLVAHRGVRAGPRDVATWVAVVVVLATTSAAVFGLGPQAARPFAALMGYNGTDEYLYRLAGAACFGYAAMGVAELRSLHWEDLRLPNVMALVFNGLAFVAAILEIAAGRTTLLAVLVALAAGLFTFAIIVIIARRGR
ncbi:MAG TPA: hypothetical protein VGR46_01435 [Candidatus Limnocylindria bacterium]|nr:hypothetical protein [Candidatus Limnocylindria bacterium]